MGLPRLSQVPAELSSSMGAGGEAVPFLFQLLGLPACFGSRAFFHFQSQQGGIFSL